MTFLFFFLLLLRPLISMLLLCSLKIEIAVLHGNLTEKNYFGLSENEKFNLKIKQFDKFNSKFLFWNIINYFQSNYIHTRVSLLDRVPVGNVTRSLLETLYGSIMVSLSGCPTTKSYCLQLYTVCNLLLLFLTQILVTLNGRISSKWLLFFAVRLIHW